MKEGEQITATRQELAFGESLLYTGAIGPIVGAVGYVEKSGVLSGRASFSRSEVGEFISIGSDHIITTWDTDTGKLHVLTAHPQSKMFAGSPLLIVSFADLEPRVSAQYHSTDFESSIIPNGLMYNGNIQTEAIMSHGKLASFAPSFLTSPLRVSLDSVAGENCMVIDAGQEDVMWVNIHRPTYRITFAPLIRLLDSPNPTSQEWSMSAADEVKKLRYQIIHTGIL